MRSRQPDGADLCAARTLLAAGGIPAASPTTATVGTTLTSATSTATTTTTTTTTTAAAALQESGEPQLIRRHDEAAPRAVDAALYRRLPSHAQAAANNRRWLAWQTAQAVPYAKRRIASDAVARLCREFEVPVRHLDVQGLGEAYAAGIDIRYALSLSRRFSDADRPLDKNEIAGCAKARLAGARGLMVIRLYRAMALPLRVDTAPCLWQQEDFATMSFFHQGSYNDTSMVVVDGVRRIYKRGTGAACPSHVKGPAFAPTMNCSINNFAASTLAQALGWKVMCDVQFAVNRTGGTGGVSGPLMLGIMMSLVEGKPLINGQWKVVTAAGRQQLEAFLPAPGTPERKQVWLQTIVRDRMVGIAEDKGDLLFLPDRSTGLMSAGLAQQAEVIVAMLRKQAFDWIIGDLDASSGNYLYDQASGTVCGFDKDFSFAIRPAFEANYCWEGDVPSFWRNMGIPPLLDENSYADVRRLRDALPALLNGLLAPVAIRTCIARTNQLLCFTRTASASELAAMDWRRPPADDSLNGSTLLWRDLYRFS